jgi:hypothetical protein
VKKRAAPRNEREMAAMAPRNDNAARSGLRLWAADLASDSAAVQPARTQ